MNALKLSDHERASPLWVKISKHLAAELAALRESNDNKNLNESDTQYYRGQIAAIKTLLK